MNRKIRVLWLCNAVIPPISEKLGDIPSNGGGWIYPLYEEMLNSESLEIGYCAPYKGENPITRIGYKNSTFWGFRRTIPANDIYDIKVEERLRIILNEFKPDIVHIWGTEYPYDLAMVNIIDDPKRIVVHIQGLVGEYAKHYLDGIPDYITHRRTPRDFIRRDGLLEQKKKFDTRGQFEKRMLEKVAYVTGRTEWDRICSMDINPNLTYIYADENLRSVFLKGSKWNFEKKENHSIFVSQAYYPIKGLHVLLDAVNLLKGKYPDVKVYIGGYNPFNITTLKRFMLLSEYQLFILKKIKKYGLQENIIFCGELNACQMKEHLLNAHIFVMPSTIENSPNSLAEAMIMGTPCVASCVGGIPSMLPSEECGLLFESCNHNMLAEKIEMLFDNPKKAKEISQNAIRLISGKQNIKLSAQKTIQLYHKMLSALEY